MKKQLDLKAKNRAALGQEAVPEQEKPLEPEEKAQPEGALIEEEDDDLLLPDIGLDEDIDPAANKPPKASLKLPKVAAVKKIVKTKAPPKLPEAAAENELTVKQNSKKKKVPLFKGKRAKDDSDDSDDNDMDDDDSDEEVLVAKPNTQKRKKQQKIGKSSNDNGRGRDAGSSYAGIERAKDFATPWVMTEPTDGPIPVLVSHYNILYNAKVHSITEEEDAALITYDGFTTRAPTLGIKPPAGTSEVCYLSACLQHVPAAQISLLLECGSSTRLYALFPVSSIYRSCTPLISLLTCRRSIFRSLSATSLRPPYS